MPITPKYPVHLTRVCVVYTITSSPMHSPQEILVPSQIRHQTNHLYKTITRNNSPNCPFGRAARTKYKSFDGHSLALCNVDSHHNRRQEAIKFISCVSDVGAAAFSFLAQGDRVVSLTDSMKYTSEREGF